MVTFCGHREISETEKIKSWLFEVVDDRESGYSDCICSA